MADTSICPCGAEPEHSPDAPHCTNCGGIDGQGCGECPPSLALLAERDRLQAEVERLRGAEAAYAGENVVLRHALQEIMNAAAHDSAQMLQDVVAQQGSAVIDWLQNRAASSLLASGDAR